MIDERAALGFRGAQHYDAHRPSYPEAAVAFIRATAGLDHRSTVVDLGAGTGLMTRLLRPAGRLIAVEPLPEMREMLRLRVPEAEVLDGTADAIPLPEAIADAVVVAQAFHWFANEEALREISRVMQPDGALFLVWNEKDPDDQTMRRLEAALAAYRRGSPRQDTTPWREVFAAQGAPLTLVDQATFPFFETITLGHLKGRTLSASYIALLEKHLQTQVMRGLETVIGSADDDTPVVMRQRTLVFVARHRPAPHRPAPVPRPG